MAENEGYPFQFGDLVEHVLYPGRVYQVESYRSEKYFYPDEEYSGVIYEVLDIHTQAWDEFDALELYLLASSDQADEYIRALPKRAPNSEGGNKMDMFNFYGGNESQKPKPEPKPTARELSSKEAERRKQARKDKATRIDALLDEMNDYRQLAAQFGDEEYKERVEYLTLKLAEATAE